MIPLLKPEDVKSDSAKQKREQETRVRDLSMEEERLIRSINTLRKEEEADKRRVADAQVENEAALKVRKTVLQNDVETLEARKREAMRPIQLEADDVERQRRENSAQADLLVQRDAAVKEREESIVPRLEKIADREADVRQKEEDADRRTRGVELAEAEVKRSTDGVAAKWAEYYTAVGAHNDDMAKRENAVEAARAANEIRTAELANRDKELDEKERGLADRYATLESARRELLEGKTD